MEAHIGALTMAQRIFVILYDNATPRKLITYRTSIRTLENETLANSRVKLWL